jgi:hypothetical protein
MKFVGILVACFFIGLGVLLLLTDFAPAVAASIALWVAGVAMWFFKHGLLLMAAVLFIGMGLRIIALIRDEF